MGKKMLFRGLTYLLLLAMVTASIPLHQIFHKHSFSQSHSTAENKAEVKTPENECCELQHVLSNGILVSYFETASVITLSTSITYSAQEEPELFIHLFLNKAPPVVLA